MDQARAVEVTKISLCDTKTDKHKHLNAKINKILVIFWRFHVNRCVKSKWAGANRTSVVESAQFNAQGLSVVLAHRPESL